MRITRTAIAPAAAILAGGVLVAGGHSSASNGEQPAQLVNATVEVTNLAPDGGTIQTPVWVGIHDGSFDLYDRGEPISPELERLAEDGDVAPLVSAFGASGAGADSVVFGAGGPIQPGETASTSFVVDVAGQSQVCFSYASMVIPSNDAFVANGAPLCLDASSGRMGPLSFTVSGEEVLDAGSEVNDEVPENTAALAQAAPDTGVVENGVVELHPGFQADGNVLAAIPNGDFTVPGYENLQFTITAERVASEVTARLTGDTEVPAVDTPAGGGVKLVLEQDGDIQFEIEAKRIDDVLFAHIHIGEPGTNGPVAATLFTGNLSDGERLAVTGEIDADDLSGEFEGMTTAALWETILDGGAYVNVHSDEFPAGELRANL